MSTLLGDITPTVFDVSLEYDSASNFSGNSTTAQPGWQSAISLNYPLGMMIIVAVLLFVVIIGTATGNLFVMIALLRYRNLRCVSNYLIGNLALSDFLLATTILPLSTVNECLGYWMFGKTACEIWLTLDVLYCTASIWNLCAIAFDRFTATMYPVWYRGRRSAERQAGLYASVVWLVAAVICVPPVLGWKDSQNQNYKYNEINGVYACVLFEEYGYVIYSASGSFFVPLVVTLFFYASIFVVIHRRMRKTRAARARNSKSETSTKKTSASLNENRASSTKSGCTSTLMVVDVEMSSMSVSNADVSATDSAPVDQRQSGVVPVVTLDHVDVTESDGAANDADQSGTSVPTIVVKVDSGPLRTVVADSAGENGRLSSRSGLVPTEPELDSISIRSSVGSIKRDRWSSNRLSFLAIKNAFSARQAKSSTSESAANSSGARRHRSIDQREMRATIRMAIIIAFFLGFWLGFFVVYVIQGCCPDCYVPRELAAFFFWLGYSNSSVNPILYTIFNEEFRRAFLRMLGWRFAGARKR